MPDISSFHPLREPLLIMVTALQRAIQKATLEPLHNLSHQQQRMTYLPLLLRSNTLY